MDVDLDLRKVTTCIQVPMRCADKSVTDVPSGLPKAKDELRSDVQ